MKFIPRSRSKAGDILNRSLLIGAIYAVAQVLLSALVGGLSHQPPNPENAVLWWFSGTVLCLAFVPFILNAVGSRRDTVLAVWATTALVRTLGTGIEGSLFRPAETSLVLIAAASGLVISLLFAWLAVRLIMPLRSQHPSQPPVQRTPWGWAWRVLLVGLAYVVFYFVFGAINAALYTRPFYENNAQYGLSLPPVSLIFLAQLIRGPLFGLGAMVIVRASDLPRRQTAIWLGLLLFVLGGLGPYVETVFRSMPLGFNLATLTELFLQNFLTGVVAAFLYKPGIPGAK